MVVTEISFVSQVARLHLVLQDCQRLCAQVALQNHCRQALSPVFRSLSVSGKQRRQIDASAGQSIPSESQTEVQPVDQGTCAYPSLSHFGIPGGRLAQVQRLSHLCDRSQE